MWFKATGIFFAGLFILFVFVLGCQSQWQRRTQQLVQDFYLPDIGVQDEISAAPVRYLPEQELTNLPEPVQRYFQQVLTPHQAMIQDLTFHQTGEINLTTDKAAWKSFTAQQDVVMHSPRFIWQAEVMMAPGIKAFVIDSYNQGRGWLQAKVLGIVTVAEDEGRGDIAEGELMRYLAESPWYPTRLLPSQGIHWQGMSEHEAMATLREGSKSVSMVFHFDEQGLVKAVSTQERYRQHLNGESVYAPWRGHFEDYQTVEGMLLPHRADVSWQINGQWQPYWQGNITQWDIRFSATDG